jgi:hypothetical protein
MTSEQKPQDQQGGLETKGELWQYEAKEAPSPAAASRGGPLLGIVLAVVAAVIVGFVIWFLVT